VSLSKDILEQIEEYYSDCLCIECLRKIQADPCLVGCQY
jgi:hypothetical protein